MSQRWTMILKISGIMVIGLLVLILAGSTWDYSGKPDFCVSCHTMESVTRSHSSSPHAEVTCTACHLGVGFAPTMLFKKATDASQVVKNLTGTYEKPIRIRHNVPVTESCESCHYTKAFRREMVKVTEKFSDDAENTKTTTALLLKVGDGSKVEGIHWHVENTITYGRDKDGNIVSIEARKTNGEVGVYRFTGAVEPETFKQMDCVDCHNRVAHSIDTPSSIVDQYLLEEKLDASLPFVKKEIVTLLEDTKETDPSEWSHLFSSITEFYKDNYPELYQDKEELISQLPGLIEEMANQIIFPQMLVTWETYENNLGHNGCFKCHNPAFKLESSETSGDWPETINIDCEICHSLPVMAQGGNKQVIIDLQ